MTLEQRKWRKRFLTQKKKAVILRIIIKTKFRKLPTLGDSLELAKISQKLSEDLVICGFYGRNHIWLLKKGDSAGVNADAHGPYGQRQRWQRKKAYPDAAVVTYVNPTAK